MTRPGQRPGELTEKCPNNVTNKQMQTACFFGGAVWPLLGLPPINMTDEETQFH